MLLFGKFLLTDAFITAADFPGNPASLPTDRRRPGGAAAHVLCQSVCRRAGHFRPAGGPLSRAAAHADRTVGLGGGQFGVFMLPLFSAAGGALVCERAFSVHDLDAHYARPGRSFPG